MKKSTLNLLVGILLIVAIFVADAILSSSVNFADPAQFGTTQYAIIAVEAVILVVAIVLIVLGAKASNKEKNQQ